MKKLKLLLSALLLLGTTKSFSQNVTNFYLFVINPNNCPYSITGYWVDTVEQTQWPLFFTAVDTSSAVPYLWNGQAETTSATSTMSICVVPAPPCNINISNCTMDCIQQVPVTPGSYTILLCDSTIGIDEQPSSTALDNKYYDLLGREIKDITTYPMDYFYIKNGRKYIKTQQ
jgi:hypothetical protein